MSDEESPLPHPIRRWLRWLRSLVLLGLVMITALVAAGWFFRIELGQFLRTLVIQQAKEQGYQLEFQARNFRPLSGGPFEELRLSTLDPDAEPLLEANRVNLQLDLIQALQNPENAKVQLEISQARSSLPWEGSLLTLEDLTAKLSLSRSQLQITDLQARAEDLKVTARGAISLAGNKSTSLSSPNLEDSPPPILRLLEELPPGMELILNFKAEETTTSLEGSIQGRDLIWQSIEVDQMQLAFSGTERGDLTFPSCTLIYGGETLTASGSWRSASNALELKSLKSELDLTSLWEEFNGLRLLPPEAQLLASPVVSLSGEISLDDPSRSELKGSVEAPQGLIWEDLAHAEEFHVAGISGQFHFTENNLEITDARARLLSGEMALSLRVNPWNWRDQPEGDLAVSGLDLDRLCNLAGVEERPGGVIHADLKSNVLNDTLHWSGSIEAPEVSLMEVPLLRDLSPLILRLSQNPSSVANPTVRLEASLEHDGEHFRAPEVIASNENVEWKGSFLSDSRFMKASISGELWTKSLQNLFPDETRGKVIHLQGSGFQSEMSWNLSRAPHLGSISQMDSIPDSLFSLIIRQGGVTSNIPEIPPHREESGE